MQKIYLQILIYKLINDTDSYLYIDLRVFYYDTDRSFWGDCRFDSRAHSFDGPVCYRGEAIRYAQSGYLLGLVIMQIINGLSSRTKYTSVYKHKLKSIPLNVALLVEIAIICLILYLPSVNIAFGTRPLLIYHWAPPLGMFIIYFFFDEFTKYLIRNIKNPDKSRGWPYRFFYY